MKVFIQNEAASKEKNIHNEKTLEYKKTIIVSRPYPYPYGFILDTTSGDGENVDCFVMTKQRLIIGQIVDCKPIGLMEVIDNGKEDHKIISVMNGETAQIISEVKEKLTDFINHVFDHAEGKIIVAGKFLGQKEAIDYINRCMDDHV